MKKFTAILLTVLMIASLFISCENKITPVSDETVSVSFDESTSRSLTASLDPFKANDYYWAYKAVKRDNTGLISGQTIFAWIDNVNKGLTKKVAGFSQGVWEFTLYAYKEEGKSNTLYSETGLAYTGTNSSVTLIKGADNKVLVRVNPISNGNGYLKVDTSNISMKLHQEGTLTENQLAKFEKKVKVTNLLGTEEKYPVDGIYTLPAGAYKVTVRFENKENSLEYASGSVVATVYANMTTTVQGTLDEILTNADFETEINPDVMNRNVSSDAFNTSSDNDITINKKGDAVDEKVSATVPKTVAKNILSNAITTNSIDQNNTTNEMKLSLTVDTTSTGVTEDGKSTIAYEIGMSSILTSTNNTTSEVTQYSSPVTGTLADFVVAEVKLQSGLASVSVTHNGNAMEKLSNATATPSEDYHNGAYYYDSASGLLTIKTKSFSPFEVTYKAVTYIAEVNGVKYASLDDAVALVKDDTETTIKLLSSASGNGIKVPSNKKIIFDFDGNTYNIDGTTVGSSGTETNGFQLLKDSTIKFMNGKITSNKAYILIQNYSNLTLENMVLDGSYSPYTNPYTLSNNNGIVLIKDSTITARAGKVAFDVCRYSSYTGPKVTVEGNSVINGDVEISSSGKKDNAIHELAVTGGTFNGDIKKTGNNPDFIGNITGGTFSFDPSEYVANGYETKEENGKWIVSQIIVAKIGDSNYYSLEEAIDAATDGAEIILNSDISKDVSVEKYSCIEINTDKNIIINGNNHKIKLTGLFEDKTGPDIGTESYGIRIKGTDNKKTVTLKNLVIDTNNIQRAVRTEENIGVKFDKCKITTNGCGIHVKGANNVEIKGTDIIVYPISNKFLAHLRSALMIGGANANVLLENSNISAINENKANMGDTNWYWSWCKGLYAGNSAKNSILTVSDTTVSADYSIAIDGTEDENNISKIIINSGSYNGIVRSPGGGSYKSIEITGGIFTGFSELNDFYGQTNSVARLVISGGTFPFAPDIKYIKNGYIVVDNGNNAWNVIENQTN